MTMNVSWIAIDLYMIAAEGLPEVACWIEVMDCCVLQERVSECNTCFLV